jgi:hypothetical protein
VTDEKAHRPVVGGADAAPDEHPEATVGGGAEPRSVRAYLVALALLWVVPALLVLVLHVTLPDHNASGQCSGLGFGCTLPPSDVVILFGYLAALPLFLLGIVVCLVIAIVQSRRERRNRSVPGQLPGSDSVGT